MKISPDKSDSFEQVFLESYESAMGVSFVDDASQPSETQTRIYPKNEAWDELHADMWLISHPTSELSDTDKRRLELTRLLGQSILTFAYQQIVDNPNLVDLSTKAESCKKSKSPTISDLKELEKELYYSFESQLWYEEYAKRHSITIDEAFEKFQDDNDPNGASPVRIANWPKGDRLNCLGVAIAMAAVAEYTGAKSYFASDLRPDVYELSLRNNAVAALFDKMRPSLKQNDLTINVHLMHKEQLGESYNVTELANGELEITYFYSNHYFDTPESLRSLHPNTQYHHYLAAAFGDSFMQIDPYMLNYATITQKDQVPSLEDERNIINHCDSSIYDIVHKALAVSLQAMPKIVNDCFAAPIKPNAYKSHNFVDSLNDALRDAILAQQRIFIEQLNADPQEHVDLTNDQITRMIVLTYSTISNKYSDHFNPDSIKYVQLAKEALNANDDERVELNKVLSKYIDVFHADLAKLLRYNSDARKEIIEHYINLPYLLAAERYSFTIETNFMGKPYNTANLSAEFGDPAIMVGAMYMNHYSRWRKDDKINIARDLARFLPSQLLWHAALQDQDVEDSQIQALGDAITTLPAKRLHPMVLVAKHLRR